MKMLGASRPSPTCSQVSTCIETIQEGFLRGVCRMPVMSTQALWTVVLWRMENTAFFVFSGLVLREVMSKWDAAGRDETKMVSGQKSICTWTPPGWVSVEVNLHLCLQTLLQIQVDPDSTAWKCPFLKLSGHEASGVGAVRMPTLLPVTQWVHPYSHCSGWCLLRAHSCPLL